MPTGNKGVWSTQYHVPGGPSSMVKQFHLAGYGHKDYNHVQFPIPYCYCDSVCPLVLLIVHQVCLYYQMGTQVRIVTHFATSQHFPAIREIDITNSRVLVQRAAHQITKSCAPDLLDQLRVVGAELQAKRFYLDGCHARNWMWLPGSGPGETLRVVAIDGELYSQTEYWFAHFLVSRMDMKNVGIIPLPGCHRCYHWFDGPRLSMKQVLEGRSSWPSADTAYKNRSRTYACLPTFAASGGRHALDLRDAEGFELYDRKALQASNNLCQLAAGGYLLHHRPYGACSLAVLEGDDLK
mmetsp:Transcript_77679/g.251579  ORF Transcript_77679/g.251579 Transcript_77679/m.251579 type:complete len:295 (-) Transcript_77679:147-1031(-)